MADGRRCRRGDKKKGPPSPALKEEDAVSEERGNAIAYEIGDKVAVPIGSDMYGRWHPATVAAVFAGQQKYVVLYDDDGAVCAVDWWDIIPRPLVEDDDEEEEENPPAASCFFKPGDRVELLRWHPDYGKAWYPSTVKGVLDPDTYTYVVEKVGEDKEEDEEYQEEGLENFRPGVVEKECEQLDLRRGAEVEVRCGGVWAIGVVVQAVRGSQYEVAIGESKEIKATKKIDELRPRYNWDWDSREWNVVTASMSPSEKRPCSPIDKASDDFKNSYDSESSASKKRRIECQQLDVILEGSEHALVSNTDDSIYLKVTGKTSCKLRRKVLARRNTDGSLLDGGLTTTISHSCQAPRNEDATQIPFIKSLPAWSTFEEMEVFKKMPQRPHFGPLQKEWPVEREGIALGLMGLFANVVESITKSSIEDTDESFEKKKGLLSQLKDNGFSVDKLQACLNKFIEMKSEYAKCIKEKDVLQEKVLLKGASYSRIDELHAEKIKAAADLEKILGQYRQEVEQLKEEKERGQAELSELHKAKRMVDKACYDIRERFGHTLADYLAS